MAMRLLLLLSAVAIVDTVSSLFGAFRSCQGNLEQAEMDKRVSPEGMPRRPLMVVVLCTITKITTTVSPPAAVGTLCMGCLACPRWLLSVLCDRHLLCSDHHSFENDLFVLDAMMVLSKE
jgi:hypothetical protein